ncbi:hypothetical protein SAMN05444370_102124 [Rubrimonas cliftonensis]|uniref:Uncharacterized protein n=2 Tax=Rubrimonas cliftonensis TaxID=89524 RepID=A0A1H3WTL4_9RHOB|nr:hypothetical protein SAMN05444370_102124 [Rubrimonas cliftonensis]
MSQINGAAFEIDAELAGLALEAATLLSTIEAGSTTEELRRHACGIEDALDRIEPPLARKWMAATAQSLRHAALFAAARPDLAPAAAAAMVARLNAIAQSQIAIVAATTVGARPAGGGSQPSPGRQDRLRR